MSLDIGNDPDTDNGTDSNLQYLIVFCFQSVSEHQQWEHAKTSPELHPPPETPGGRGQVQGPHQPRDAAGASRQDGDQDSGDQHKSEGANSETLSLLTIIVVSFFLKA